MESLIRTDSGKIRFVWKLAIILVLLLVLIIISRLSFILLTQQIFILQGTPPSVAFQNAQLFVSESPEGQAIASLLDLILMFFLVFIFITRFERHEFHLTDLGLNIQRSTLPFIGLGLIIGSLFFLGSSVFGLLLGTLEFPLSLNLSQWSSTIALVASMIFYTLNSFWQELVFRGYLQTRAVEEHGKLFGIMGITIIFVIFHGLVQTLTPLGIITGLLLFSFIGLLYEKTRSLYFVSAAHAVLNFLPILFDISFQGFENIITYGIALVLLLLLFRLTKQST